MAAVKDSSTLRVGKMGIELIGAVVYDITTMVLVMVQCALSIRLSTANVKLDQA